MSFRFTVGLVAAAYLAESAAGFSIHPQDVSLSRRMTRRSSQAPLFMTGTNPDDPLGGGELVSSLARMEDEWKVQQATGESRWTTLVLPDNEYETVTEQDVISETPRDFVYLLEPPTSTPSRIIVFTGGAGLGQFPQIAYSELLERISDRLNAAVLTVPYSVGLDHFSLAKQSGELLRRATDYCKQSREYPESLPVYCLTHSLGGKLQTIYMAATGQDYDGIGFISFNNFSFSRTMGMAKEFASQMGFGSTPSAAGGGGDLMSTFIDIAQVAVGAMGLDFSPTSDQMDRLIQIKYTSDLQSKTRLFMFDNDNLDSTPEFVQNCRNGDGPSVSDLPGTHLTPVYFSASLEDVPTQARSMAAQAAGDYTSASFGDEPELNSLVDEVCDWVEGKQPSREPNWVPPRMTGGMEDTY